MIARHSILTLSLALSDQPTEGMRHVPTSCLSPTQSDAFKTSTKRPHLGRPSRKILPFDLIISLSPHIFTTMLPKLQYQQSPSWQEHCLITKIIPPISDLPNKALHPLDSRLSKHLGPTLLIAGQNEELVRKVEWMCPDARNCAS